MSLFLAVYRLPDVRQGLTVYRFNGQYIETDKTRYTDIPCTATPKQT